MHIFDRWIIGMKNWWILLTEGRGSKMDSETKVETENIKPLESSYGSWSLGNQ